MITVRVDGVLLGTQREMLLELPDVRLVERLLDAGEGACQETDVLVLSGSERIPSALGHRFPELKLLVLSRFRGRECLPDLPAGAELVVLPQSREPLLGARVWSHLLFFVRPERFGTPPLWCGCCWKVTWGLWPLCLSAWSPSPRWVYIPGFTRWILILRPFGEGPSHRRRGLPGSLPITSMSEAKT